MLFSCCLASCIFTLMSQPSVSLFPLSSVFATVLLQFSYIQHTIQYLSDCFHISNSVVKIKFCLFLYFQMKPLNQQTPSPMQRLVNLKRPSIQSSRHNRKPAANCRRCRTNCQRSSATCCVKTTGRAYLAAANFSCSASCLSYN